MNAFNTVRGQTICPTCSNTVEVVAEFKFGSVWQLEYRIDELLEWGRNDRGESGHDFVHARENFIILKS